MRPGPVFFGFLLMLASLGAGIAVLSNPDLKPPFDPLLKGPGDAGWDDGVIRTSRWPKERPEGDFLTEDDKIELSRYPVETPLRPGAEEPVRAYFSYRTRDGDTLPLIAQRFLGLDSLYTVIAEHNPGLLSSGFRLREGTSIRIPLWLRHDPLSAETDEPVLTEFGLPATIREIEPPPPPDGGR